MINKEIDVEETNILRLHSTSNGNWLRQDVQET